ncbi:MAG: AAA family ATPase [Bacteroidetes bacterium]|nr:AAA family ATPase [Bacteroidota bacterium]
MTKNPFVIGICGGSGSGKTTLLKRLSESFSNLSTAVFSMDNYYFPIEKQAKDKNGIVNFDLPKALNEAKLTSDLLQLIKGEPIEVKEYFFNSPPDKNVLITIEPADLLIVEGLFLFHYKEVSKAIDYSVFVDVDHGIQLDRRLYRDQETRGYKRADILYQWDNHVLPCYEQFIEPYRNRANFIFRNDHNADTDFDSLRNQLIQNLDS